MKRIILSVIAAAALIPAARAADVGVSVSISQPGVYGRIDIGRFPQPVLVAPQPVLIAPPRMVVVRPQPVYMWVPPGHQKKWNKHCHKYNACGVPVYFVKQEWYDQHVRYSDERGGKGKSKGKGKHKD